jgi:alcohol dehydrogenase
MKAIVAQRYGGPEVLDLAQRPEPDVGPTDVLVAVRAASLNPLDSKIRNGNVKLVLSLRPPIALGCDVAGVVVAVGARVSRFTAGNEVYARLEDMRMGGLAERVVADESVVALKPARASFAEAAAVPLAALTSLQALRESAALQPGQRVLVHAGAGGVGTFAIQIAKILGLWVATTTSTKNVDFVKALGADEVIDYTKERVSDRVRDLDAVFDTVGATELESVIVVKPGGVVVGIAGLPDVTFSRKRLPWWASAGVWLATAKRRRAAARASARFVYLFMRPDGAQLAELASWIDAGKLKPIIHRMYPLTQFREAFAELECGRARGKIVVTM